MMVIIRKLVPVTVPVTLTLDSIPSSKCPHMTNIKRGFLLFITLSSVTIVWAVGTSAKCSWAAPTAYVDGSVLAAADIDHYTLTWVPSGSQAGPSGSINVAGGLTSTTVPVACGSVSFTLSVTTGPNAKYPNATSAPTGAVPYVTGVSCTPNPPTGLAVQ